MDEEQPKENCCASSSESLETTCWGCGLQLLLSSYSPIFKCGWCGAITNRNQKARKNDSACFSQWRRVRDHFFVAILFMFMSFVICAGLWAIYPMVFSISYFCGIFHCTLASLLAMCTISTFCLAAFLPAGGPAHVLWGSYPAVVKGGLDNYTFCIYCAKPKCPRTHHCRSCKTCVLDMDHHCPFKGPFFIYAKNATSDVHTSEYVFKLIDEAVEMVGKENVVQVVTDNASNFVLAGKLLMEKRKNLFWTPCAAHCLDLMLEDISKLQKFAGIIKRARKVTTYIYQHIRLHDAFLQFSEDHQELSRSGVTRFATNYLTLTSLLKQRKALASLFISEVWNTSSWSKTQDGKHVYETVMANAFWEKIEDYLRAVQPIVTVLRLVDADEKPPMGYIARAFDTAKEMIIENFGRKETNYMPILQIIDSRWDNQMARPLYGAGCFLNPAFYYKVKDNNEALMGRYEGDFIFCLERMVNDPDQQDVICSEMEVYKGARGMFGRAIAIRQREKKPPLEWWDTYGSLTSALKRVAKRILGLCCTSSSCERNWSAFDFIGNCVGAANHRHFIAFLISIIVSCTYVVGMGTYAGYLIWPPLDFSPFAISWHGVNSLGATSIIKDVVAAIVSSALLLPARGLILLYLAMACFSVEIGIGALLWQQLQFIYQGKTYVSNLSSNGSRPEEGGCQNILRFFNCPYWVFRVVLGLFSCRKIARDILHEAVVGSLFNMWSFLRIVETNVR